MALTRMNGGSWNQVLKAGALTAASAFAAGAIGDLSLGLAPASLAHGVSQGAIAELGGGEFKTGFWGGAIGHAVSGLMRPGNGMMSLGQGGGGGVALRTAVAAVAGGTVAVLGGGKFANGAKTAAFVHLFNAESPHFAEAVWPTDHSEVTSGFDPNRKHPVSGEVTPHRAIDIVNPKGDPVYSILDGVVADVYQGGKGSAGNYLKVDHANGLQSSYAHTGSGLKNQSQVRRGQVIGFSDGSGIGTGPHLHLSVRRNGNRINPCSVLSCP